MGFNSLSLGAALSLVAVLSVDDGFRIGEFGFGGVAISFGSCFGVVVPLPG
jgi:hypothetical protein